MASPEPCAPGDEWVQIAFVLKPHGLKGDVLLKGLTRTPDELIDVPVDVFHVWRRGQIERTLTLDEITVQGVFLRTRFHEVTTREEAEALAGATLVIPESERWDPPEGSYYHDDLVGMRVVDEALGDLGPVLRVQEGAAHDYIVFRNPQGGRDVLMPFVEPFLVHVGVAERLLRVRLPGGLLDL